MPALAAALSLLVTSGCSVFTTMYETPGPKPHVRPLPVEGTGLFDYKGVLHCHGYLSHDSDGTIEEIVAAARNAHVDFVGMTDHQTDASIRDGQRGVVDGVLFLVGCEQRSPQGTVLALGLREPIKRWQHAGLLAKDAAAQGGVAFLCHAESWKDWDVAGMTGVEIVNLHAGANARPKAGTLFTALLMPLRQLFEHLCYRDAEIFRNWDRQLAARHPFTPIGGDDAHANISALVSTIGTYDEVFLTLSTHVLAPELSEETVLEALRLGRTYVAFDIFGEGCGFDFRAVDAQGVHVVGSTVPASPELQLRVAVPSEGHIQLRRDGEVVREVVGREAVVDDPEPGVWRVEVHTAAGSPWLFSSSIKVTAGS
ncbi:MAG: CehA/McbA family metallohydrolase [Planctomycetes bacterium]|nr:CehA/McbA family metallohydrolase [Planctomycetota bacterium]